MNKYPLLLLLGILIFHVSAAQLRIVYNFGPNGSSPETSLIYASGKFYGMTYSSGSYGKGCLYSVDTNGNQYKDLLDFNGTNGALPSDFNSTLVYASGKLYGATPVGSGDGNIFSIDTDGSNFKNLFLFNMTDGYGPGALIYVSGKLYGTTTGGGTYSDGTVYTIDTNGNNFKTLFNFNHSNGFYPLGNLTYSAGILYGTTYTGGLYNDGCIFSLDTNGSNYKDLFYFDETDGYEPNGNLAMIGNVLCGTTLHGGKYGGLYSGGTVFSIHTDGSGFKVLLNFNDTTNGTSPNSSLTIFGNILYGLTNGPIYENGTMYSIDTNGTYHELYCFCQDTLNLGKPIGTMVALANTLYGLAFDGGVSGNGAIFKYNNSRITGISSLNSFSPIILVYPNPSKGIFNINYNAPWMLNNPATCSVKIYNRFGVAVYTNPAVNHFPLQINLSSQAAGIYIAQININGQQIIEKLVIE